MPVRHVLVLGAGQSAPYLIQRLLEDAEAHDWFVTVADRDETEARRRVGGHPRGAAMAFDATDISLLTTQVRRADVVVNFLSPVFQHSVARTCVELSTPMISASYRDQRLRELDTEARRKGTLLISEVGLDPGIDHMSAMAMIEREKARGGRMLKFASYGSGVPSLEDGAPNPLGYAVTWNPRNVVMAGEGGAQYLVDGKVKIVPYHEVFRRTWRFHVPGVGPMEAYPNRDSLSYRSLYGLEEVETMLRATLRHPGWCEVWHQIVRLGLPNEQLRIPDLSARPWAELLEMFIPRDVTGLHLEQRVATYLGVSPTGTILQKMRWLGLFDAETPCGAPGQTAADALMHLLKDKLRLPPGRTDQVIVAHELVTERDGQRERILSVMTERGEPDGVTAMAKTVGLPAAAATKLVLTGALPISGAYIPTEPALYRPLRTELEAAGLTFEETREPVPEGAPIS